MVTKCLPLEWRGFSSASSIWIGVPTLNILLNCSVSQGWYLGKNCICLLCLLWILNESTCMTLPEEALAARMYSLKSTCCCYFQTPMKRQFQKVTSEYVVGLPTVVEIRANIVTSIWWTFHQGFDISFIAYLQQYEEPREHQMPWALGGFCRFTPD